MERPRLRAHPYGFQWDLIFYLATAASQAGFSDDSQGYWKGQRMADPEEDKDYLAAHPEEDRQEMAKQVSELKKNFDIPRRLNASIGQYPWAWLGGATLTGWLLSRLPARRKEVYLLKRHSEDKKSTGDTNGIRT